MEAVNLLPEYARAGHRWTSVGSDLNARKIVQFGGGAAIVLAIVFGLLYFNERSTVSDKKSELTTAQAHLVAQQARAKPIQDAQAANSAKLASLRSVTATRAHWDAVLGDLGRALPTGVHLTTLTVGAAGATPGQSFTVNGQANSNDRVALVLDRLALLPWLSGISLQSSSRTGNAVTFTVAANYIPGAGS